MSLPTKLINLWAGLLLLAMPAAFAQRGKDGAKTVSGTIKINEYTSLSSNANAGDSILQVQNSSLNSNNRFSAALAAGDLLLIIQMQGATLGGSFIVGLNNTTFGTPRDSSWGRILSYNNCGNYEFAQVKSVLSGTQIQLECQLTHAYTASGKVQVVRIPRYSSLTVPNGTKITCDAWNGSKGGVLSFEVEGNTSLDGSVSADTTGFRGGEKENLSEFGLNETACDTPSVGAMKGEGIGGYKNDYNYLGGRYCKGAAGNAGGGGDCHNAGGGGGGNGGDTAVYHAVGVPDISNNNYITAFNLEAPGFSSIVSSGGGRGGYSASTNNVSPLTNGPGTTPWGGDYRIKNGGFGGRPLDYASGRLFLGGGGGAGDMDDNYGGSGGNGGGLIYALCYGNISGSGSFSSNGENGQSTTATSAPVSGNRGQDGAGGGGAGGTIVIECHGNSSNIACNAKGGTGGTQTLYAGLFNNKNQAQGPGGGGGGGYIRTSNANLTANVSGGANGTTNSTAMTNFPANGATKGAAGTSVVNTNLVQFITTNDTICAGNTATLHATASNLPSASFEWYDAAVGGNLVGTGSSFTTPVLTSNTDYYVRVCPLPYRAKASVILQSNLTNAVSAGADMNLCNLSSANLHGSYTLAGSTGIWSSIGNTLSISNPTDSNASISNLPLGSFELVYTVTFGCLTNADTITIQNDSPAPTPVAGNDQNICGSSATLNATPMANASWSSVSSGPSISNPTLANATVSNLLTGDNLLVYSVSNGNACPASADTVLIHVDANPSTADAGSNQSICSSNATLNAVLPSVGTLSWSTLAGSSATIANPNANNSAVSNLALGINQFVLTVSNGVCASSSDTVSITVNQMLTADAGTNQTVCSDTTHALANASSSGVWTSLGAASINAVNNAAHISNLQAGNNYFVWTLSVAGCAPSTDTLVVKRDLAPSTANAGADLTICGNTAQISATPASSGSLLWSSSNNLLVFSNPTAATCTVSNLQGGVNTLVLTISNGVCPASKDTLLITRASVNIANAGLDKSTCADTITLHAINTTGAGVWTSLGTATLSSTTVVNPLASNLQNGQNLFVYTVAASGGCPAASDTVKMLKQNAPDAANAGADKNTCDSSVVLQGSAPVSGIGTWTTVGVNNAYILNPNDPLTKVESLSEGSYQFVWTVSRPGCSISKRDTMTVKVFVADSSMQVMNDTTVTPGVAVTLHASGATAYAWSPANDLSCTNCSSPIFTGISDMVYTVTMTDKNGCTATDSLVLTTSIVKYVAIADAFSPYAADEKNRTFKIHYAGLKEFELNLFNEFGELVFSIKPGDSFDKEWDGTVNGYPALPGSYVYYYSASYLDRTTVKKSGKIYLMK